MPRTSSNRDLLRLHICAAGIDTLLFRSRLEKAPKVSSFFLHKRKLFGIDVSGSLPRKFCLLCVISVQLLLETDRGFKSTSVTCKNYNEWATTSICSNYHFFIFYFASSITQFVETIQYHIYLHPEPCPSLCKSIHT